eukprot:TRINITY_DN8170_c0_g1_i1.p1 TRINITY_DN8170_c0_g1~~TRINITY_DN8170_c0_g1_i1.p1  ORF type:complete len:312 (+),score=41.72 TRINITY_DN8170_c0_g1_i1:101-1036(+)
MAGDFETSNIFLVFYDEYANLLGKEPGKDLLKTLLRAAGDGAVKQYRGKMAGRKELFRAVRKYFKSHVEDVLTRMSDYSRKKWKKAWKDAWKDFKASIKASLADLDARPPKLKGVLRQGDLECTCAIYSTVAAIRGVYELGDKRVRKLFCYLLKKCAKVFPETKSKLGGLAYLYYRGSNFKQLKKLQEYARKWCEENDYPIELHYVNANCTRKDAYFNTLTEWFNKLPGSFAVIGYNGIADHWTCASACNENRIKLVDGADKRIAYEDAIISSKEQPDKYALVPDQIVFITKKKETTRKEDLIHSIRISRW